MEFLFQKYQTTKESISKALAGFELEEDTNGLKIFRCKGWNYQELYTTYKEATEFTRVNHKPSLVHVEEITQPRSPPLQVLMKDINQKND